MEYGTHSAMQLLSALVFLMIGSMTGLAFAADTPPHTVIRCTIYGKAGEVLRSFPYRACVFLKDGSLLVADRSGVGLLDEKLQMKWFRNMDTHHQLKLSNDGKMVMVMSSDIHSWKGKKTRFDTLLLLDLKGKQISKLSFFDKRAFFLKNGYGPSAKGTQKIDTDMRRDPSVTREFSHANSFHEIGPNSLEGKHKTFAAGNFLVNDNKSKLMFIVDRNLREILWSAPQDSSMRPSSFHDIQLTQDGKLLIYRNRTANDSGRTYSSLAKVDPITNSEDVLYERSPLESFYSQFCGGIQLLPSGNLLFDDFTKGADSIELDKNKKTVRIVSHHVKNKDSGVPEVYQESKRFDLTEFLKNNAGL